MKRAQRKTIAILLAWGIIGGALAAGCAREDVKREVVATVNGEDIKVLELREWLGDPVGEAAMTYIPADKKKMALDQLIVARLLAQDARSRGMDNTPEFRESVRGSERRSRVSALFRKEIGAKRKIDDKAVKAESARMQERNKKISAEEAAQRASRKVSEEEVRKIREELTAKAKKETGAVVDRAMIDRIGKGESVPDNAVLASAGGENVLYGDVKRILEEMSPAGGTRGQEDPSKNPEGILNIVDRELTVLALSEYARKQGIDRSDEYKMARQETERNILRTMVAKEAIRREVVVTDREVETAYAARSGEMVRNGKKIPLAAAREQIRASLQNDKRRKAFDDHIAELRKKANITVNAAVLSKV